MLAGVKDKLDRLQKNLTRLDDWPTGKMALVVVL